MRTCLGWVFGIAVCLTSAGCLAVALGGGAVGAAYVLGDIERTYPYPLDVVWSATEAALAELQLPPGFDSKDQLTARFDRRTATGDRIRITLASRGQFTKLSLRVNTFGDKSMSHVIVGRIESHLPEGPSSVPSGIISVPPPEVGITAAPLPELDGPDLPRPLPPSDDAGSTQH